MSKAGGYRIIDLGGKELTLDVGMVFPGIYSQIEGTRKRIVLSGLNVGGKEFHDVELIPIAGSEGIFTGYITRAVVNTGIVYLKITISDVDVLTVSQTSPV